ncbi:MAG: response regulator transcription factor [Nitrospirae bacterium]|nr:response regulator transcription factor [Nitrospirota bacterium]
MMAVIRGMNPMKPVRILLVDDSLEFLLSSTEFLSTFPELKVVGEAKSGEEALKMVGILHPDLVLMDLRMPGIGGLEAVRLIKQMERPPRTVFVTIHDDLEYRASVKKTGADGFVGKSRLGAELLPLIRELFRTETKYGNTTTSLDR